MPRGRGGARQGTPGKGYSNRTDMTSNYNQSENTAASGGMTPPAVDRSMPMIPVTPDQTPNLSDPTNRPDEPITAGLPVGPGPGLEAMTGLDPRQQETQALRKWLPLLEPMLDSADTPESVKILVRYIRGS